MNTTISRVEKALERQQARIQALEAALAPFAQAWEFRRPSGNGDAWRAAFARSAAWMVFTPRASWAASEPSRSPGST